MGADGTIMYFNEAAERAFRYAGSEVAGASVESVLPGVVEAAGGGPIEALAGSTGELTGTRKGGGELQPEAAFSDWSAGGKKFPTAGLHDVGERRQAHEAPVES